MKKIPQLDKTCADELRPSLNHVIITKDNIVATNGNIIAVLVTNEIFDNDFINEFPNDKFYIASKDWKIFKGATSIKWDTDKSYIQVCKKNGINLIPVKTDVDFTYPNWKAIIPNIEDMEKIGEFGMDIKLLYNLSLAMPIFNTYKFIFTGRNKGILVIDNSGEYKSFGMIMPIMIN
jgi:hypothetical protein